MSSSITGIAATLDHRVCTDLVQLWENRRWSRWRGRSHPSSPATKQVMRCTRGRRGRGRLPLRRCRGPWCWCFRPPHTPQTDLELFRSDSSLYQQMRFLQQVSMSVSIVNSYTPRDVAILVKAFVTYRFGRYLQHNTVVCMVTSP